MSYNYNIIIIFLVGFLFVNCTHQKETTSVVVQNISESVYASGYVKTDNQYDIHGNINAIVEEILVNEGDSVRVGQAIFLLNNKSLKLNTENAALSFQNADIKRNQYKILDAEKSVQLALKKYELDSIQYERQKVLWSQNVGSKVDLEQKSVVFENSKTSLKKAETLLEDLKRQVELSAAQSKNNLKIAKIREEDLVVRSNINGVVYQINRAVGEPINGQDAAAVLGTRNYYIELNIDEVDVVKIQKGQKVVIKMESYPNQVFDGVVTAINPLMNKRTRTFVIEAKFEKQPNVLFPNMTVESNIIVNTKDNALTIPRKFLKNDSLVKIHNGDYVKVQIGLSDYDFVEVVSGLDTLTMIELPSE